MSDYPKDDPNLETRIESEMESAYDAGVLAAIRETLAVSRETSNPFDTDPPDEDYEGVGISDFRTKCYDVTCPLEIMPGDRIRRVYRASLEFVHAQCAERSTSVENPHEEFREFLGSQGYDPPEEM